MTVQVMTAEDRARARESRRLGTDTPPSRIPKAPREDEPPKVWPVWALKMRHELQAENKRLQDELRELKASIMATERARAEAQNNSAMTIYGETEEVKDLTKRLEFMLPNAQEIGSKGVAMLAQIAVAHGLDPLPGSDHVYAWIDKKGKLLVAIGYKGLLHLARQQVQFTHQSRPMTPAERKEYGVLDGQLAYITELYEIAKAAQCQQTGIPYYPIIGTAIWSEEIEHRKKDGGTWTEYNTPPTGKTGAWVCRKNSLKDALRQIARTGVRMGAALDAAFQQTAADWAIPIAAQATAPDVQSLIESGVIKPDQDGDEDGAPGIIDQPSTTGAVMPPTGVCDRCMSNPVADNPFGLCASCAEAEAAKDLGVEQQPLMNVDAHMAESDVPRKK